MCSNRRSLSSAACAGRSGIGLRMPLTRRGLDSRKPLDRRRCPRRLSLVHAPAPQQCGSEKGARQQQPRRRFRHGPTAGIIGQVADTEDMLGRRCRYRSTNLGVILSVESTRFLEVFEGPFRTHRIEPPLSRWERMERAASHRAGGADLTLETDTP
jgi:hypothetical protein